MMRRFTLIQGGLSEHAASDPAAVEPASTPLQVDLRPASGIDACTMAAWRALMTRTGADDPFQDPDYLLTAAQHQAGGQEVAFALAWSRPERGPGRLHGVMPLSITRALLARNRAQPWQPPDLSGAPLLDAARAEEIVEAVRDRLRGLARPIQLVTQAPEPDGQAATRTPLALAPGRRRAIPPASLLGVRPDGYRAPSVEQVRDPGRVRDAVETFLALDARTARRPIIADPADAAMVRVVSRLFARRRQIAVELARQGDTVISGTLHLGTGTRAVAWRHAAGS